MLARCIHVKRRTGAIKRVYGKNGSKSEKENQECPLGNDDKNNCGLNYEKMVIFKSGF